MVYRIYVEKKEELANEARGLKNDLVSLLSIKGLKNLRLLNRYDVEGISEELFENAVKNVFSEPQLDIVSGAINKNEDDYVFAVEYLPGQFDQRADSAAQCIQIISQLERPLVKTAKVYILQGNLSEKDISEIKKYVINPVESREASLEEVSTLKADYEIPETVAVLDGFIELDKAGLENFIKSYGL